MSRLVDYQGHLAIDFGWITNWSEPQREHALSVSTIRADSYTVLLDREIEFTGNMGRVYNPNTSRFAYVDTTDWEHVNIVEPVKKPRRGKDYDWEWAYGQWRKTWR